MREAFPGHGDTSVDSHLELPLVEHPPDRIRRVECVPFREAIRAEVAFIMTAHVLVPSSTRTSRRRSPPNRAGAFATSSSYQGVIVSDDLEMKAIAKTIAFRRLRSKRLRPDATLLLVCSGNVDATGRDAEALVHAAEEGRFLRVSMRSCGFGVRRSA